MRHPHSLNDTTMTGMVCQNPVRQGLEGFLRRIRPRNNFEVQVFAKKRSCEHDGPFRVRALSRSGRFEFEDLEDIL